MSDRKAVLLAEVTADNAVSQDEEFFANVQTSRDVSILRIAVVLATAVELNLVPNTGTAIKLNGGAVLVAGALYMIDVPVDIDRTWSLTTPNIAGTTVNFARVIEMAGIV